MKKKLITVENGNKVEYNIIVEFTSKNNNKHYVAYTNNKKNKDGHLEVLIAYYTIEQDLYVLTPITNSEEIEMVNSILNELRD